MNSKKLRINLTLFRVRKTKVLKVGNDSRDLKFYFQRKSLTFWVYSSG